MAKSSLLTPDDHALLLIDHQYLQLLTLRSHTTEAVVNNTTFLAKAAKLFKVPALLTTAFAERHSGLNSWDDLRVRDWVKRPARRSW
jgi:nicotinamidase-related amidase